MKKTLILSLIAVILCIGFNKAQASAACDVYLIVEYPEKLLDANYDVDIYVDKDMLATIHCGDTFSTVIENISEDEHSIKIYKTEDKSIYGVKLFTLEEDSTLSCSISSKKKEIEISSLKTTNGIKGSKIKIPDLKYIVLSDAISTLKELGFNNIQYISKNDDKIHNNSNWIVISQSLPAKSVHQSTETIELTCIKTEDFAERFVSRSLSTALKVAKKYNFKLTLKNAITGQTEKQDFFTDLENWNTIDAKFTSVKKREILLSVIYNGETYMPNLCQMRLSDAIECAHSFKFSNIDFKALNDSKISLQYNWKVIEQSISFGEKRNATDELTLICRKIEKGESIKTNSPESQYDFSRCYEKHEKKGPLRGSKSTYDYYLFYDYSNKIVVKVTKIQKRLTNNTSCSYEVYHKRPDLVDKKDYNIVNIRFFKYVLPLLSESGFLSDYPLPQMIE